MLALALVLLSAPQSSPLAPAFDEVAAERFANLALACVTREYPNKIAHTLESAGRCAPGRFGSQPSLDAGRDPLGLPPMDSATARTARRLPHAPGARAPMNGQSSRSCRNTGCAGSTRPSMTAASRTLVGFSRLRERRVTAFPLQRPAARVDEREIPARGVLEFEHGGRPVGIASLTEHVHQRDGPLPPLWIGDDPALEVLPVVQAPGRHRESGPGYGVICRRGDCEQLVEGARDLRTGKRLRDQEDMVGLPRPKAFVRRLRRIADDHDRKVGMNRARFAPCRRAIRSCRRRCNRARARRRAHRQPARSP